MSRLRRSIACSLAALALALSAPRPAHARRPFDCRAPSGTSLFSCLGAVRARAGLCALLEARPRDMQAVAPLVAAIDLQDARPVLRGLLDSAASVPSWNLGAIAQALADLGDIDAAPLVVDAARRIEGQHGWKAVADALRQMGGPAVTAYARELLGRTNPATTWGEYVVPFVLDVLAGAGATDALPAIARWSETGGLREFQSARLWAGRVRLGDQVLVRRLRVQLGTPNAPVPVRPEFAVAALGDHPDDVPGLVRMASSTSPESGAAYDAIDRLGPRLDALVAAGGPAAAPARRARAALVRGLQALTAHRENRAHVQFEARMLARHHVSLARLGDLAARRRLLGLIGEEPVTVIPWIAATGAAELGFGEAAEAIAGLVARSMRTDLSPRLWEARAAFVERAAALLGDRHPAWTGMLLDPHPIVRRRALAQVARLRPTQACEVVATLAPTAPDDAVDDALVAWTTLGNACTPWAERLFDNLSLRPHVRGVALELLAMSRAPSFTNRARRAAGVRELRVFLGRACAIARHVP